MAAATTILAATALAVNTGMSINKSVKASRAADRAEDRIENYPREEFRNVYAGISLPMEGFRLREEAIERNVASVSDSLADAGARGVIGGIPGLLDYSDRGLAQIGADIEKSKTQLDLMIAEDEKRIQGETARREEQDLRGLGALYAANRQDAESAISSIPQTIGAIGNIIGAIEGDDDGDSDDKKAARRAARAAREAKRANRRADRAVRKLDRTGIDIESDYTPTATFDDLLNQNLA